MSLPTVDVVAQSLLLPLQSAWLQWPQAETANDILFVNARPLPMGGDLPRQRIVCQQDFRPTVDALEADGLRRLPDTTADRKTHYPLILLLPQRQRELNRAQLARAAQRLSAGGILLTAQSNQEGARSLQDDMQALFDTVRIESKHKCRVLWNTADSQFDRKLAELWSMLDAARRILADTPHAGRFISAPGVFAWDRIDPASALLVEHLPADLHGCVADLGAGWGFLSASLLERNPGISALHAYEADAKALPLLRHNLAFAESRCELQMHWQDVTRGLRQRFDVIVSNPPFHAQQAQGRPDIGRGFIHAAADALQAHGQFWLVANRHLPYEADLRQRFAEVHCVADQAGFKVIFARRPQARSQ